MSKITYYCSLEVRSWIDDNDLHIPICSYVYEPAEDTWLAYRLLSKACKEVNADLCIDVGTGTGVLGLFCANSCTDIRRIIATDINPCALYCAKSGFKRNGLDFLLDIVQCDKTSCLRGFSGVESAIIVYNTPYLPDRDECQDTIDCLYSLSWSGGISEALEVLREVNRLTVRGCAVLVFSSLSYPEGDSLAEIMKEIKSLKLLLREMIRDHFFFEDIYAILVCNYDINS